jgi:hypothetical protein
VRQPPRRGARVLGGLWHNTHHACVRVQQVSCTLAPLGGGAPATPAHVCQRWPGHTQTRAQTHASRHSIIIPPPMRARVRAPMHMTHHRVLPVGLFPSVVCGLSLGVSGCACARTKAPPGGHAHKSTQPLNAPGHTHTHAPLCVGVCVCACAGLHRCGAARKTGLYRYARRNIAA